MNSLRFRSAAVALVVFASCSECVQAAEVLAKPVLLLTGFEPFGTGRPPNSSWEGIKALDGRVIGQYTLACREMQVEWGAPLVQLGAWIDELRPAAVMSFGQGGPGYAIETRARNTRGHQQDNEGNMPPTPLVAAEGPEEFAATIDVDSLVTALANQRCGVRLSRDAGQYLCEETLYTLELLKQRDRIKGDVLFCHVPPLHSDVGGAEVTADDVQKFVERLVTTWAEPQRVRTKVLNSEASVIRQAAPDPREADVRALIERYFRTWSAKDMDRYAQCFLPQAAVQLLEPEGKLVTMPLRPFLQSQTESHRTSKTGMTEAPESIRVTFEGRVARAVVFWKLVEGARVEFGYDHFTLVDVGGQWRIANLLFYATPEEEGP
jgi:pyroglutamyl-peptidase